MKGSFSLGIAAWASVVACGCAPDLQDPPVIEMLDGPVAPFSQSVAAQMQATGTRTFSGISAMPGGGVLVSGSFDGEITVNGDTIGSKGAEDPFAIGFEFKFDSSPVSQTPMWFAHGPGPQLSHGALIVDGSAANSLVAVGEMSGSLMTEAGGVLTSSGGRDAFVVKEADDQGDVWAVRIGGAGYQSATSVAIGNDKNVRVAGLFSGELSMYAMKAQSVGGYDVFFATLDLAGKPVAGPFGFGGSGDELLAGMAVGADGSLCLIGEFEGQMTIDSKTLGEVGARSVFVTRFDAKGDNQRFIALRGTGFQEAGAIAVDQDENILVAGSFSGTLDFGDAQLVTAAERALFVAKLDASGKTLWARAFGEAGVTHARGVAVGPGGTVGVVGDFTGKVRVGDRAFDSHGQEDLLVIVLDASGKAQKADAFGDAKSQRASGGTFDEGGSFVVIGQFEGKIDAGETSIESMAAGEPFVLAVK